MIRKSLFLLLVFTFFINSFCGEPGENTKVSINNSKMESSWAEHHIQKAFVKNVIPDIVFSNDFRGARPLTKGELAVLISRVLPCDISGFEDYTEEYNAVKFYKEQAPKSFSDFTYWDAFGYVERVTKRGILNPLKGKFNPEEKVTRGEFLKTLLVLLQKTQDPFANIASIACDSDKLNKHLTGFMDVSVAPSDYPGWVRMAQEYNILPSRDEEMDFIEKSLSIPYKEVFYNFSTRRYEFQADVPVSRELAVALFSNLFIKWDGYGEYIPFDVAIGNTSKDIFLKTINGDTKVDCELVSIDPNAKEIEISFQQRKTEFRSGKTFNTVFVPGKQKYAVADNAYIWVALNGKMLNVRGDDPVSKLNNVINKLKDENIFDIRVNYICVPEKHRYNVNRKILVKENEYYDKREVIGYLEVNLIPYDYIGRIIAKGPETVTMYDQIKGNVTFEKNQDIKIIREVIGLDGATGLLSEKIINQSTFDNIKEGEQVKIKLDRDGKVRTIVSRLLRIGVPSNVDVMDKTLKTQYYVGKHFEGEKQDWDARKRAGLIVYNFDYDYPGKWRTGSLNVLFSEATSLKKVDLYVQPADIYAINDSETAKYENRIFFIEAIPKFF